jgi:DNA-binding response OmpR family regulator
VQNRTVAVIAEDNKFLGHIEKILMVSGYLPVVVNDANLAAGVIESKPDVILLELRMLHKNGFELTVAINQAFQTRRIPLIAVSDVFREEFSWLLDLCGIKTWLKKQFHPLNIIWAIENEIEEGHQWSRKSNLAGMEMMA